MSATTRLFVDMVRPPFQYLRDWSRSGGSYGNNTRVICCPAPGRPESAARGTSPPDNKSRGCCCRNSRPTVINPDYNMTKQRCMKRIYDKIHPKSPPNLATSSCALGTSRRRTTNHEGVVAVTPDRPWSIPIITWLNNVVWNVFTTKYTQNHHQI